MTGVTRTWRKLRARVLGRTEPVILMYHRVTELSCDPWRLAVTPDHFAEQIEMLTRRRTVVPLDWLVEKLESGRAPESTLVITFDDGYVDVLRNAKPVLERFGASATAFLTTGAIGRRREFWWDALARILLESPALPERLTLPITGRAQTWNVDAAADRGDLHLAVWRALRPLADDVRAEILTELERWAGTAPPPRPSDRALDPDEARELAASGAFSIGAHSISHASLPALTDADKRREVGDSRSACEQLIGHAVTSFAYPFGDRDRATERVVAECGFLHACATDPGVAVSIRDRFHLPRVAVEDWSAEELARRLDGVD